VHILIQPLYDKDRKPSLVYIEMWWYRTKKERSYFLGLSNSLFERPSIQQGIVYLYVQMSIDQNVSTYEILQSVLCTTKRDFYLMIDTIFVVVWLLSVLAIYELRLSLLLVIAANFWSEVGKKLETYICVTISLNVSSHWNHVVMLPFSFWVL
jgi:hypothetical protein